MPYRHRVHDGTDLTNVEATLLTFGDNLVEGGAILWHLTIVNRDSTRHKITVCLVPFGLTSGTAKVVFEEYVPAHAAVYPSGPWHGNSKSFITAIADAASPSCGIRATASQEEISN